LLVCHVVGVGGLIGVCIEGVVMTENVFLDALIHVSAHGEEVLGVVLVLPHLLGPCLVAQQPLFVSHVALYHFLVSLVLLQ
jgi:hypothetical protein